MSRAALAILVIVLGVISVPAVAFAGEREILETHGEDVAIPTPAPGHAVDWELAVRAPAEDIENLRISLVSASGTAVSGPDPLVITLRDGAGEPLASGTAEQLIHEVIYLPKPHRGEWTTLTASAELPFAADDSYRGSRAHLQFRFTATLPSEGADQLPFTGVQGLVILLVLAIILIITGVWMLVRSSRPGPASEPGRRRSSTEPPGSRPWTEPSGRGNGGRP